MILTAKNYLDSVLKAIGIPKIYGKLADIESAMEPALYAVLENHDPENYTPSHQKELFTDDKGVRTYHIKDYDVSAILVVRIGASKEETANSYKREFLKELARHIDDPDGYRIDVTPLSGDLNPEDLELPSSPHVLIRVRFDGGLWRQENTPLIQGVVPSGQIVRNKSELEAAPSRPPL